MYPRPEATATPLRHDGVLGNEDLDIDLPKDTFWMHDEGSGLCKGTEPLIHPLTHGNRFNMAVLITGSERVMRDADGALEGVDWEDLWDEWVVGEE